MKTHVLKTRRAALFSRRRLSGATLVDLMVSSSIFSMVILAVVYTQLFCLRLDELANSKLGATDTARRNFDQLTSDIRSAKMWYIGTGDNTAFTPAGNATNQIGNALQVHYTTDTNSYVRYFFNTNSCELCRFVSGSPNYSVVANNLTNASGLGMRFEAQRYDGTQLADLQFKYVIVTTLEFCQYQYPLTRVGPGYFYNYYRVQFKVASHNFD